MRELLAGLRVVYSDRHVAGSQVGRNAQSSTKARDDADYRHYQSVHPVVRTHPETGRKALYIVRPLMLHFENMSEAESDGLAEYLYRHSHRPEFTCRFRWEAGSVAFWDNRCVQHTAVNDTGAFSRVMRRVQLEGDEPR